jgi:hypothetical protein
MLSIRDCLDYCDLTDDEVALIAEHERIPNIAAAHIVCGMVQTVEGLALLGRYLEDLVERATRSGQADKAARARNFHSRLRATHPAHP